MCKTVVAESPAQLFPLLSFGAVHEFACGAATSLITCYHHTAILQRLEFEVCPPGKFPIQMQIF